MFTKYDLKALQWILFVGFAKKLMAVSQANSCTDLKPWIQSIVNHMYWCASSSQPRQSELMLQKWLSVEAHIQNVHSGHGELFPNCAHGPLEGREARKKWLAPCKYSFLLLLWLLHVKKGILAKF